MSGKPDVTSDSPTLEQQLATLSVAFDAIRLLTPSRFEDLFESTRESFEAHKPADDHLDVPILVVPLGVNMESERITDVEKPVEYWSTPDGSHNTLDVKTNQELRAKYEVVLYIDCREHAETLRHFRATLLLHLANRKTQIKKQREQKQNTNEGKQHTNQDKKEGACDICEIKPVEGETGFIGVSTPPRNSSELSRFSFLFCGNCGVDLLELLSSFEPINQPTSRMSFSEIFMQQSECGFCGDPMEDHSTRAGINFIGPMTKQTDSESDREEELYAICPDCCSVFRTFLENIGLPENMM